MATDGATPRTTAIAGTLGRLLGIRDLFVVDVIPMETLPLQATGGAFLPVYFIAMAFVVGTAVFLMALIKERAVAEETAVANADNLTGLPNRAASSRPEQRRWCER